MIRSYSFFLILLTAFSFSSAQSILGLQYPMGLTVNSETGFGAACAGTGTGVQDEFLIMSKNVANLGSLNRAVFSSILSIDLTDLVDSKNKTWIAGFNPRNLSLSIPIAEYGSIAFAFNQNNSNNVSFRLSEPFNVGWLSDTADLGLVQNSGVNEWKLGYGYSITRWLRMGIAYKRIYFNRNTSSVKIIRGSVEDTLIDSTSVSFKGNGISGGILIPVKKFTFGFSGDYVFPSDAQQYSMKRGTRVDSDYDDSLIQNKSRYEFRPPPSFSVGLSYQITPEWIAAMDAGGVLWNKYYPQLTDTRDADNAYSFSLGTQYIPEPDRLSPGYFETIRYRAGFRYSQLPVSTASEFALSLGFGLPLQQGAGFLDIVMEGGRRSDSNYDNYSEKFLSIKFGINGGRKWYQSSESGY